jgi:hypothetical protein
MMSQEATMASTTQLAEHTSPVPPSAQPTEAELFASDPLLSGVGIAKDLWADEHADEYVARIRKDW